MNESPTFQPASLLAAAAFPGLGHMIGGEVKRGVLIDASIGGGSVQSLYKSYDRLTGNRVDGAKLWNISGELLPYRTRLTVGVPLGGRRE